MSLGSNEDTGNIVAILLRVLKNGSLPAAASAEEQAVSHICARMTMFLHTCSSDFRSGVDS